MSAAQPDARDAWIEGEFEGVYAGDPLSRAGGSRARRFAFELQSGSLRDVAWASAPESGDADDAAREIRQARVSEVSLPPGLGDVAGERELFDVRIRDWRLLHPAEIRGRAYGTIVGRLRARLRPPLPQPLEEIGLPLPPPAQRASAPSDLPVDVPESADPTQPSVDATDAAIILARLRRFLGWLAALLLAGAFAWLCSVQTALLWAAPLLAALLLRRMARPFVEATRSSQRWLGVGVVACQLGLALPSYESAWHGTCLTSPELAILWTATPLLLAALLRSRTALLLTAGLWSAVMCASCATTGARCAAASLAAREVGLEASALGGGTPPRTDAGGRWPADPRGFEPPFAPGGGTHSFGPLAGLGRDAGDAIAPEPAASQAPGEVGVTGLRRDGDPALPDAMPPIGPQAARTRAGRLPDVPGGWVAPEAAHAESELISLERANRHPDAFFDADGRRVYLQTDPIFENGGSRLRARGPLELTRLANLLATRPEQRVRIEVHSDAGGGPREQVARSERRADVIRDWLARRGRLSPDRFEVIGVGGVRPIVPTDGSYAAQQPNRRIEVQRID